MRAPTRPALGTAARAVAATLAALLLSGCGSGGGPAGDGGSPPTASTSAPEVTPADPTTEPEVEPQPADPTTEDLEATEEAQPPQDAGVAVALAGLPVGGFPEVSADDPTLRCVRVNWSGPPDLPAGLNLEVTRFDLAPDGVFQVVDGGCSGQLPGCLSTPGVLDDSAQCDVAVRQVSPSVDGVGSIGLAEGRITCEAPDAWRCEEFVRQLATAGTPRRIEWDDAVVPPPVTDVTDVTDAPDATDATQDG
ncbi:hypothetical protein [Ornithinimicrobium sp. LYQ103]|uniref:hypothetical protein n=1 Tax=Ornithinimicrobium sp. LYQ103 TaxID=3378796 RepID=UPI003852D7E4